MAKSSIRPRIRGIPRPRLVSASRGAFQAPVSATVKCRRSTSAVACNETVPSGRSRWPCSIALASGFAAGNEHVDDLIGLHSRLRQPAAQGSTARREVVDVSGEFHLEWSGLPVEQHGHVVSIAASGLKPGHEIVRHLIEGLRTAVLNEIGSTVHAVIDRAATAFDQTVGVEQQRRARRHRDAGFGAGPVGPPCQGKPVSAVQRDGGAVGVHHDGRRMARAGVDQFDRCRG